MTFYSNDFAVASRNGLPGFTTVSANAGADGFDVTGSQTIAPDSTLTSIAYPTSQPSSGDEFAQVTLVNNAGTSSGVFVRGTRLVPAGSNDVSLNCYLVRHNGTNVAIIRLDNTVSTVLANVDKTRAAGDVLRLTAQGTVLKAYINDFTTPVLTYDTTSDTTKYATGIVGLRAVGAATQPTFDNWFSGDLADVGQVTAGTGGTGGTGGGTGTPTYTFNTSPTDGIPRYKGIVNLPSGKWVYPGRPLHLKTESFFGPDGTYTAPAWLTTAGTAQVQSDSGLSRLQLTTAATTGAKASIAVTTPITLSGYRAIRLDVEGISFSAQNPNVYWRMGAFNDTLGINNAIAQDDTAATTGVMYAVTSGTVRTSGNYSMLGQFAMRRRPASVLLVPGAKEIYFMMDDRILLWRAGTTDWVDGLATLKLEIEAKADVAASMRLSSLSMTLYA